MRESAESGKPAAGKCSRKQKWVTVAFGLLLVKDFCVVALMLLFSMQNLTQTHFQICLFIKEVDR